MQNLQRIRIARDVTQSQLARPIGVSQAMIKRFERETLRMATDEWRARLQAALEERGETMRSASLKAGLGANYLHGVLRDGKDATVDRLIKVCEALEISIAHVLTGANVSNRDEALLAKLGVDEELRRAVLVLLGENRR